MPNAPKRPCRKAGCKNLSTTGWCEEHSKEQSRNDIRWRGSPASRGYDKAWAKVASLRRKIDCYLCQECKREGLLTPCCVGPGNGAVDHIVPVHVRQDWRLELSNTQCLCQSHHAAKTIRDNAMYGSSEAVTLTAEQRAARQAATLAGLPATGGVSFS